MLCCVTLSRVITLYKQYHTHPGPVSLSPLTGDKQRQLPIMMRGR